MSDVVPPEAEKKEVKSRYNATLLERVELRYGLVILRVRPDFPIPSFEPGQFTTIGLSNHAARVRTSPADDLHTKKEKLMLRAYSVASPPSAPYLEFYISLVTHGGFTPRLYALQPGDRLYVSPAFGGHFTLKKAAAHPDADLILISTGTGLAPYLSMIRATFTPGGRRFVVIHGVYASWDLGYRAELEALARSHANFFYLPTITNPEVDPTFPGLGLWIEEILNRGLVEEKTGLTISPDRTHVYLCGNPKMIQNVTQLFVARGLKADTQTETFTIHTEEYWK